MLGLIDTYGNYYEAEKNITGAIEVTKRPTANHIWQKGGWVYIAPPITDVRKEKRREIVKSRNDTITGGFSYLGKTIDSDRDSVMAITGAAVAALAAKSANLPYAVIWTCADDSTIPLDADGVLGMAVTLAMFADAQHAKARPLKESIAKETDPDKIKKVKW